MVTQLKRWYLCMVSPAAVGLIIAATAKEMGMLQLGDISTIVQQFLFVLAAVTALAAPLLMRTLFANSLKDSSGVGGPKFLRFQQRLMGVAMLTPWWALFAMVFEFQKFYASSIILMALYAVYYYFPSQRRIAFDRRIFRVKE